MAQNTRYPMYPTSFRVLRAKKETHDTSTIEIEPLNGNGFPSFLSGQFTMLYVFGVGEVPVSISGGSIHPKRIVHTIRSAGIVSGALSRLKAGDVVGVRGPFGNHWPLEEAVGNDVVIVAGGIGLAPLRPVVCHLFSQRERYGRITLLYGARTPQDLLYKEELKQWRGRFDVEVKVTVDRANGDWKGDVGVVTTFIPHIRFDPIHTTAMICGPEIMMRYTIKEMLNRGVEPGNIYISMERNMKCGIGLCGHCQCGPAFICKDGPIFRYDRMQNLFGKREI